MQILFWKKFNCIARLSCFITVCMPEIATPYIYIYIYLAISQWYMAKLYCTMLLLYYEPVYIIIVLWTREHLIKLLPHRWVEQFLLYIHVLASYCSQYWVGAPWSSAPSLNAGNAELEHSICTCVLPLSASPAQNLYFNKAEGPFRRIQPEIARPN